MTPLIPLTRDLVLVGGGHAHALVLRMWGMKPMAGVRVTVINPGPTAPYTGMLPGFVAGHYSKDDLDIDLVKLCRFAGARLIFGHATGLDQTAKTVQIEGRPDVHYDVISLDVGIHTQMPEIAGFADHGLAAKPLDRFAESWGRFLDSVETGDSPPETAVIGGGIGGAELALAMAHRLRNIGKKPKVTLLEARDSLTGVTAGVKTKLEQELSASRVELVLNAKITEVTANAVGLGDQSVPSHFTVGAAGGKPHAWIAATDLDLVDGYIAVENTLASVSDPDVFAAGDCAHLTKSPRPKAGVFAVRAAPVLLHNLEARLAGRALKPFKPQSSYLKLISLGRKAAIAEKGAFTHASDLMWTWKNRIDTRFMDKFRKLPKMPLPQAPNEMAIGVSDILNDKPLCGGCGAKVGAGALHDALCDLAPFARNDVLTAAGDDAAVLKIGGRKQVVSVDHLRAFDTDLWRMARIATVHALGDIWAMGAEPQSVLVNLILPRMSENLQRRTVAEIMEGVQSITQDAGAEIVGGHTSMGAEMTVGLTVTGLIPKGKEAITLAGAKPDDVLILTKPIGSGTLLAAEMQGDLNGGFLVPLLAQLQASQGNAARILSQANAMTDVTGFGLGGHLLAMCKASNTGAEVQLDAIPVFDGAEDMSRFGHRSSIYKDNAAVADRFTGLRGEIGKLVFDPQTAGGLLAAVAPDQADEALAALLSAGYPAAIIGKITGDSGRITCV